MTSPDDEHQHFDHDEHHIERRTEVEKEQTQFFASEKMWHWLQAGFAFIATCLLGIMTTVMIRMADKAERMEEKISEMSVKLAEMRSELDIVKPSDVLRAVNEMNRYVVSRQELRDYVKDSSPWSLERDNWQRWRQDVDNQLRELRDRGR